MQIEIIHAGFEFPFSRALGIYFSKRLSELAVSKTFDARFGSDACLVLFCNSKHGTTDIELTQFEFTPREVSRVHRVAPSR